MWKSNPDYNLKKTYSQLERSEAFNDPMERMEPGKKFFLENKTLIKLLPSNYQKIDKDSVVIIISQEEITDPIGGEMITLSLMKSPAYEEYRNREDRNGLFMDPKENEVIRNNSKLRYVTKTQYFKSKITYMSKSRFEKIERNNINTKEKIEMKKNEKQKRKIDVINEI